MGWFRNLWRDCMDAIHQREMRMLGFMDEASIVDDSWFKWEH